MSHVPSIETPASRVSDPNHTPVSTRFPWDRLLPELKRKILQHAPCRVVVSQNGSRRLPDELRPPEMPPQNGHPWPGTIQTLMFERARCMKRIVPQGPILVTFSDEVDHEWEGFARFAKQCWSLDEGAVYAQMLVRQHWTAVCKIRMHMFQDPIFPPLQFTFELLGTGEDGQDVDLRASALFRIVHPQRANALGATLVEKLHLRHSVVQGGDEYAL